MLPLHLGVYDTQTGFGIRLCTTSLLVLRFSFAMFYCNLWLNNDLCLADEVDLNFVLLFGPITSSFWFFSRMLHMFCIIGPFHLQLLGKHWLHIDAQKHDWYINKIKQGFYKLIHSADYFPFGPLGSVVVLM